MSAFKSGEFLEALLFLVIMIVLVVAPFAIGVKLATHLHWGCP